MIKVIESKLESSTKVERRIDELDDLIDQSVSPYLDLIDDVKYYLIYIFSYSWIY